jgi:serine/threonine-protein kinase
MLIAHRFQIGERRWGDGDAGLYEGLDLLVGRPVLLELVPGGQLPTSTHVEHPQWIEPRLAGVRGDTAFLVHRWAPAGPPSPPPDPEQAAVAVGELLNLLAMGHAAGMVHGSVLPESVTIGDSPRLAATGMLLGSSGQVAAPALASPRVRQGHAATAADDVWALAAVAYFALTSAAPRSKDAPRALVALIERTHPERASMLAAQLGLSVAGPIRVASAARWQSRPTRAAAAVALAAAASVGVMGALQLADSGGISQFAGPPLSESPETLGPRGATPEPPTTSVPARPAPVTQARGVVADEPAGQPSTTGGSAQPPTSPAGAAPDAPAPEPAPAPGPAPTPGPAPAPTPEPTPTAPIPTDPAPGKDPPHGHGHAHHGGDHVPHGHNHGKGHGRSPR